MVNDMRTYYLSACLMFAAACGDKATDTPTTYALTTQSIAELQAITTDTGTLICTADGYSACPLNQPVANRLSDGRILLWQPGGTVMLVTSGDSGFVLIGSDSTERPYLSVVAATTSGRDRIRMIDFAGVWRSLTVSLDGSLQSADTLAEPGVLTSIGFLGNRVIRQRLVGWDSDSGGRMRVALLRDLRDTVGNTFLDAPVHWLRGGIGGQPPLPPMLAAHPVWALIGDDDVIWSPGDRLMIERRSRSGKVRWRIDGNIVTPVTEHDLDLLEAKARESMSGLPLIDEDFASMRSRSDTLFPPVTGITVSPEGVALVALATPPSADSVTLVRINSEGRPVGRLVLPSDTRVLVAVGDSLMVHQQHGETELREVRWLRLSTAE